VGKRCFLDVSKLFRIFGGMFDENFEINTELDDNLLVDYDFTFSTTLYSLQLMGPVEIIELNKHQLQSILENIFVSDNSNLIHLMAEQTQRDQSEQRTSFAQNIISNNYHAAFKPENQLTYNITFLFECTINF
jgi:hypothetical protein